MQQVRYRLHTSAGWAIKAYIRATVSVAVASAAR